MRKALIICGDENNSQQFNQMFDYYKNKTVENNVDYEYIFIIEFNSWFNLVVRCREIRTKKDDQCSWDYTTAVKDMPINISDENRKKIDTMMKSFLSEITCDNIYINSIRKEYIDIIQNYIDDKSKIFHINETL